MYTIEWTFLKNESGNVAATDFEYHQTGIVFSSESQANIARYDLNKKSADKYYRVIKIKQ